MIDLTPCVSQIQRMRHSILEEILVLVTGTFHQMEKFMTGIELTSLMLFEHQT